MTVKIKYLLVLPCFNEAESLSILVPKLEDILSHLTNLNVLLIDNGSTDKTAQLFDNYSSKMKNQRLFFMRKESNSGYGAGIKYGLQYFDSEVIIWSHSDLQCELNDVSRAIREFESANKIIVVKGRRRQRSLIDELISVLLSVTNLVVNKVWIPDINSQPNLIPRFLLPIDTPDDSTFELFIFTKLKKSKISIKRFDVNFPKRSFGNGFNEGIPKKMSFIKASIRTMLKSY